MKVENIGFKHSVIQTQRLFFDKGETRSIKSRKKLLKKLSKDKLNLFILSDPIVRGYSKY